MSLNNMNNKAVLFVCLGNICRSPLAEGVARKRFADAGLAVAVASCGTGSWHVGEGADRRSRQVALEAGYDLEAHRVRQLAAEDFERYDWLLAMDASNLATLRERAPAARHSRMGLLLDVAGVDAVGEVPDPYYGEIDDFRQVRGLIERGIDGLIRRLA
ncbi:low molecular weight protein-tyrosine-phosphatase [Frateuria aurantia]